MINSIFSIHRPKRWIIVKVKKNFFFEISDDANALEISEFLSNLNHIHS